MTPGELRRIRELLGLTHVQLAKELHVREDTVQKWQNGKESVPYRVPAELAAVAQRIARDATAVAEGLPPRPRPRVALPDDEYQLRVSDVTYAVLSLEGMLLGDLRRLRAAIPPAVGASVGELAGKEMGKIAQKLAQAATQTADPAVKTYLSTGARVLRDAAAIRNAIVHARPATHPTEGQRLYRWVLDRGPAQAFFIDNAYLDQAVQRLDELNDELNACRPSFSDFPQ